MFLENNTHKRLIAREIRVMGISSKRSGENCLNMPFSFSFIVSFLLEVLKVVGKWCCY